MMTILHNCRLVSALTEDYDGEFKSEAKRS